MAGLVRSFENFMKNAAERIKEKYPGAKNYFPLDDLKFLHSGVEQKEFFRKWVHSLNLKGLLINKDSLNDYVNTRNKDLSIFNAIEASDKKNLATKLAALSNDKNTQAQAQEIIRGLNDIFTPTYQTQQIDAINNKLTALETSLSTANPNLNLQAAMKEAKTIADEGKALIVAQHKEEQTKLENLFKNSPSFQNDISLLMGLSTDTDRKKLQDEMKQKLDEKQKEELTNFEKTMTDSQNNLADIKAKEYHRLRFLGMLAKHPDIRRTIQEMNDPNLTPGITVQSQPGENLDLTNIEVKKLEEKLAEKKLSFITPMGTEMISLGYEKDGTSKGYQLTLNRFFQSKASTIENIQFLAMAVKASGAKSIVTTIPAIPHITPEEQVKLAQRAMHANILGGPFPDGYTIRDKNDKVLFSYNPTTGEIKDEIFKNKPNRIEFIKNQHQVVTESNQRALEQPDTFVSPSRTI